MDKKSILLVEDDPIVRDIIKSALGKEYNILEASSYSETIKLIRYPIDVAIIDYILPDKDGFEVLKALREVEPSLPAIIMTGYSDENLVIKAIRKEVADFIKKPLDLSYLRRRLSELFGNEVSSNKLPDTIETREELILDSIAAYIQEKYMKEISLERIARMACMSKFRFCRIFKQKFGRSFISYLNTVRIKNAVRLLKNPNFSITEVAYLVGYRNANHFNRVFKAVHKISPREYRKNY